MNEFFAALPALLKQMPDSPEMRRAVVFAAWRRAAGRQLRDHATATDLADDRLTVAVADKVWQRQLASLAGEFIYKINSSLGQQMVTYVEFVVDPDRFERVPNTAVETGDAAPHLTDELRRQADAIRDDRLREEFLRAAGTTLARNEKYGR